VNPGTKANSSGRKHRSDFGTSGLFGYVFSSPAISAILPCSTFAIDSKLRACDLLKLRVRDIAHGDHIARRAIVLQQKTLSPVQFEITEQTRSSVVDWIKHASLHSDCYLFRTRQLQSPHLSTRQYARIVGRWIGAIGLDVGAYGTHTMRRTKASLIYRRTKNLRAVQLLLGHSKLESTVRYLGIEVDDALEMAEQTEV
jgi:integrase